MAVSDIGPGFKLNPPKNQHFPVTILTVIRNGFYQAAMSHSVLGLDSD